jgi:AraC family transcriptional regulator of adaptative response / DNA-3-methyladenine glycosylase II
VCRVGLTDQRDLVTVVSRMRRLLDLDADPSAVDAQLGTDPALGPLIAKRAGLRSPGAVDGFELAVRAVVGQQISVSGARTLLGQMAAEHGTPAFAGGTLRLFPSALEFASIDPDRLPMPKARGHTLVALARVVADGELSLDPGADRDRERATLLAIAGIGPWTADYVQMRTMSDPDVLLASDLGVRKSARTLGVDLGGGRPEWAPWRSYASHHFWAALH